MVLFRFLGIFRVDTGLQFLKAIAVFLKQMLIFQFPEPCKGLPLPIVKTYSWFSPSRISFSGLHPLNISPKEQSSSTRRFQVGLPPLHVSPHPQLELKHPVVVSGWEYFWTFGGYFTFTNAHL